MKIGVWQSNYIPWKGYFDYINDVDIFCFYDEVQYTKNDWRNRNRLLNDNGLFWLTIPVDKKYTKLKISDVPINKEILKKHFKSIQLCYSKSLFLNEILNLLSPYYLDDPPNTLSELNQFLLKTISQYIGIKTKFVNSKDYELKDTRLDRLIHLNTQLNSTSYLSGINAKNYISEKEEKLFRNKGINVEWKKYGPYLKYNRIGKLFDDQVSIIDLLMNIPQNEILKYIKPNK